jgi:hypothetical protein
MSDILTYPIIRRIEEERGKEKRGEEGKDRTRTRQDGTKSLFAHCDIALTLHVRR